MGRVTVPYDRAIARTRERDDDSAAPIVPEDNANAAVLKFSRLCRLLEDLRSCSLDELRPRFGPEIL